jgi:hypothetical protein
MNWEYMSCRVEIDPREPISDQLNEPGKSGWELVSIVPIQDLAHQYRAFFKRPLTQSI